jgi:hypothetical protein
MRMMKSMPHTEEMRITRPAQELSAIARGLPRNAAEEFAPYPIALLTSGLQPSAKWGVEEMKQLRTGLRIPQELRAYLMERLVRNINLANVHHWNTMLENGDQCIVR